MYSAVRTVSWMRSVSQPGIRTCVSAAFYFGSLDARRPQYEIAVEILDLAPRAIPHDDPHWPCAPARDVSMAWTPSSFSRWHAPHRPRSWARARSSARCSRSAYFSFGVVDQNGREPPPDEGPIEESAVQPDVCEQPVVLVETLLVELEANALPLQFPVREAGALGAVAFNRLRWVDGFGSVDAEKPDIRLKKSWVTGSCSSPSQHRLTCVPRR